MTASVITLLAPITEEQTLDVIPYALQIKGQTVPNVKVRKIQNLDAKSAADAYSVSVEAPVVDGKPLLSLSTMDAIARRILPGAFVTGGNKSGAVKRRMYSANA